MLKKQEKIKEITQQDQTKYVIENEGDKGQI